MNKAGQISNWTPYFTEFVVVKVKFFQTRHFKHVLGNTFERVVRKVKHLNQKFSENEKKNCDFALTSIFSTGTDFILFPSRDSNLSGTCWSDSGRSSSWLSCK